MAARRGERMVVEVERMRAALIEIRDFPYVGAQASARITAIARRGLAAPVLSSPKKDTAP